MDPMHRRVADPHRQALAALYREREIGLADRRLDYVLDDAYGDAVARRRFPVHPDVEVRRAGHLLGVDVRRARDATQNVGDGPRPLLQDVEVVAEDLHADLGADTGREHVDSVDDRLGPDFRYAGQRRGLVQFTDELLARHARPPLTLRFQVDDRLRHFHRRPVRRGVCPRDPGRDAGDLAYLPHRL